MSRRVQENLISGVLLAAFIGIIVLSLDYSPRARMIPLPLAVLGVILVVVQLIWQNVRSVDELQVDVLELLTGQSRSKPAQTGGGEAAGKQAVAFTMVAVLLAIFLLLGPLPAVFLFTAGYLIVAAQFHWPKALAYAVGLTIIVTIVFGHVLKVPVDRSILLPEIGYYIGL
jgi:Tripartite tricarboxylate transporter TctB family